MSSHENTPAGNGNNTDRSLRSGDNNGTGSGNGNAAGGTDKAKAETKAKFDEALKKSKAKKKKGGALAALFENPPDLSDKATSSAAPKGPAAPAHKSPIAQEDIGAEPVVEQQGGAESPNAMEGLPAMFDEDRIEYSDDEGYVPPKVAVKQTQQSETSAPEQDDEGDFIMSPSRDNGSSGPANPTDPPVDQDGDLDMSNSEAGASGSQKPPAKKSRWDNAQSDDVIFGAAHDPHAGEVWDFVSNRKGHRENFELGRAAYKPLMTQNRFDVFDAVVDQHSIVDPKNAPASIKRKHTEVASVEVLSELPHNIRYPDEEKYPRFLACDKFCDFPLDEVYGGAQAFRGQDRPKFQVQIGPDENDVVSYDPTNSDHAVIQIHSAPDEFATHCFGAFPQARYDQPAVDAALKSKTAPITHGAPNEDGSAKVAQTADKNKNIAANKAKEAEDDKLKKAAAELSKQEEEKRKLATKLSKFVKVMYLPDTQYGCTVISIEARTVAGGEEFLAGSKEAPRKVRCEIYANSLRRSFTDVGFRMSMGKDREDLVELPLNDDLAQHAKHDMVVRTDIDLIPAGDEPAQGATGRPIWQGISRTELTQLGQRFDADASMLSESEGLIVLLDRASSFTIFKIHRKDEASEMFARVFRSCMYACAILGNFWWYVVATADHRDGKTTYWPLSGQDFPWSRACIPRWMIKKWKVHFNEQGVAIESEPAQVEIFGRNKARGFPDDATSTFVQRLATMREQQHGMRQLKELTAKDGVLITAKFIPGLAGHYVACVRMAGKTNAKPSIKPGVGTRVKIGVHVDGYDVQMSGGVVEDAFETDADYCVQVLPEGKNADKVKIEDRTVVYNINVAFQGDIQGSTRQRRALEILQAGQHQTEGPWLPSLVLGAPLPEHGEKVDYMARQLTGPAWHAFNDELQRHRLNPAQMKACVDSVKPGKGVLLLWGPPGTGKTRTLIALLCALSAAKIRVVVCGPTNGSVALCAREFQELTKDKVDPLSWAVFAGGLSKVKVQPDAAQQGPEPGRSNVPRRHIGDLEAAMTADDEASAETRFIRELAIHEQLMSEAKSRGTDVEDIGFATKKLTFIQKKADGVIAEDSDDKIALAKRYMEVLERVRMSHTSGGKAISREERYAWADMEESTNAWYIEESVSIVFVTNNSSAHPVLTESFKPEMALLDEAGLASAPDLAIPLTAYKEHLRAVVPAGDPEQLGPIISSMGVNEGQRVLEVSLFEDLLKVTDQQKSNATEYDTVMLDRQYRMTPDVSEFVRRRIYRGKLFDDESVMAETDLQKKIKAALKPFQDAGIYNGRARMCIDSRSPSAKAEGSTSVFNEFEAQAVARMVHFFVIGNGIEPENVLVVTPYNAQLRAIQAYFRKFSGEEGKLLSNVQLSPTYQAQGREQKIVLLSLVQHEKDANHLGFVGGSKQLTVEISRAKDFEIIFGNFDGWRQLIVNGKKVANRTGHLWTREVGVFRDFISDCLDKGDVMLESEIRAVEAARAAKTKDFIIEAPHFKQAVEVQPPKATVKDPLASSASSGQNKSKNKKAKTSDPNPTLNMGMSIPERPASGFQGKGKGKGKANMK
ncbi:unnamed protein product [Zymoseptoria tritici ST99CH_1A5]|uniref:DNA2/NAM7 helicase-like C-terminal domain-containing protein n=1 Tax=Zymoseptoria tritici ST99CH_1A5 TaxID=1276529 RepID=A0A1Y6LLT0_ZYMTR|nr:unnamed protein product [Zymoseptoria tritici ST99CH_3D1]SMY25412.1 unnamed protein product [Zymoseptoria tritici ST99CH_1A5]